LAYQVRAEGTFPNLLAFLTEFYTLNLPHLIRNVKITPPGPGGETKLDIDMRIEALSMPGAVPRDFLPTAPDKRLIAIEVFNGLKYGPSGLAFGASLFTSTGLYGRVKLAGWVHPERNYQRLAYKNVFA